ncbi:hypothetical protein E5D53_33970 [Pseudomonas aeruginosa]|nr:hypothetical protein E5D53_33970 [Pseudomonas aeruginosa]
MILIWFTVAKIWGEFKHEVRQFQKPYDNRCPPCRQDPRAGRGRAGAGRAYCGGLGGRLKRTDDARPDIKAPRTGPEPGSDAGLFVVPAPRQCLTRRSERTDTNVRTQAQH